MKLRSFIVAFLAAAFLIVPATIDLSIVSARANEIGDAALTSSPKPTATPGIPSIGELRKGTKPGVTPTPGIPSPAEMKAMMEAQAKPTPRPRVVVSTPSPTPMATQLPTSTQTLADLQMKIRNRVFSPDVSRGRIGVKIISLNSGKVIFENDADKYFMPASNMKNFTVATAMERLTPDYRYVTSVYAQSQPDASGVLKGDLRVFGRGDVSVSTAFYNGDYYRGLDNLADAIARTGVKRIEGSLLADESYFKGDELPGTWEWDDLQWYYGAGVSALPLNDNAVDVKITAGNAGSPCIVNILPANTVFAVNNTCTTGSQRNLTVTKRLNLNILDVSGTMASGDVGSKAWQESVAITHPAELFISLLKQRLELKGVTITGGARVLSRNLPSPTDQVEIAKLESPPFALIAAKTLKPSQNMYTETILWTLGEDRRRTSPSVSGDSGQVGLSVVKEFLASIGIPQDGIVQHDGSGLSRHDLITPSAVVTLYSYMAKQSRYAQQWRDSLTIGGVDGTLRNRFKGTAAEGNMRGKTGTIDQVSALSGYISTATGEPIVLSIVVNGVPTPSMRTKLIDDIVVNLANFNGKLD